MKGGSYGNNDDILQRCYYWHRTHTGIPRHSTFNRLEKEMTINSRQKGCRYERHIAQRIREYGYEAERGCQHAGGKDSPDVKHNMVGLHIEAKKVEKLNIWNALAQSERDAGEDEVAVVMFSRNRSKDYVAMDFDDFMRMWRCYERDWSEDE